jgi:hypothetical protein
LFLILFLVAALAGAASLKTGGARPGELCSAAEFELTADVASVRDDLHDVGEQMGLLPARMRNLWDDAQRGARVVAVNTSESARDVAHRIVSLVKTS